MNTKRLRWSRLKAVWEALRRSKSSRKGWNVATMAVPGARSAASYCQHIGQSSRSRQARFLYAVAFASAICACVSARAQVVVARQPTLKVTDVSPDAAFGSQFSGDAPMGRVVSLVIDPSNDSVLYAATETAGVWKTTDGGHSWRQASNGIRNGIPSTWLTLAIDENDPRRLLFASMDDDGRVVPDPNLWASND